MPSFNTEVGHELGQVEALSRMKSFLDTVREKFKDQVSQLDGQWVENALEFALTTYGFKISGNLAVEETAVRLTGQLPFAALAFRGKIEQSFAKELRKVLGSASSSEPASG